MSTKRPHVVDASPSFAGSSFAESSKVGKNNVQEDAPPASGISTKSEGQSQQPSRTDSKENATRRPNSLAKLNSTQNSPSVNEASQLCPKVIFRFHSGVHGERSLDKVASEYEMTSFFQKAYEVWQYTYTHHSTPEEDMFGIESSWGEPKQSMMLQWKDSHDFSPLLDRIQKAKPDAHDEAIGQLICELKERIIKTEG